MISIQQKKNCSGCHACASVCPAQCIEMVTDEEGFLYPTVNKEACLQCGLCDKICPIIHPAQKEDKAVKAYSAYNKDQQVRLQSSSGGLFTLFATAILQRGGVVFGAGFDAGFNVVHSFVDTVDGLAKFRGAKYVQSVIGDAYKQAEDFLKQGKWVMFTGTPCQIGGLYAYLRKDYPTLFTQDIVCHGAPSPLVWKKYLDNRTQGGLIREFSFRDKRDGWGNYRYTVVYQNGEEDSRFAYDDAMSKFFLSNLSLRPSCYQCAFKGKYRQSDITLADYWGVQEEHPAMFDNKGTSLLLVNSTKGAMLFSDIQSSIDCIETDVDKALSHNPSAVKSVQLPKRRKAFMADLARKDFACLEKKYGKAPSKLRRVVSFLKRKILRK